MSDSFPHLFSPIAVGAYTLKNRIMNTGHAAHFQTGDGLPTRRYVDYVGERAKGGAGIVVTGHTVPYYDGEVSLSLASYDERIVPMYQRMAAATHAYEVPLLAQLGHRGRRVADGAAFLGRPSMAPSAVPAPDFSAPQLVPHAMTIAEIEETLEQFAAAGRRAVAGDLDGVELAIGMDYLFPNFLNAQSNRREDRYGGATLEERMTFLNETVDAVRGAIGPGRILGIRMYDDLEEWGLKLDDYGQVARLLEAHGGVDYFNMWQGIVPSPRSGRAHWPAHYYPPARSRTCRAGSGSTCRCRWSGPAGSTRPPPRSGSSPKARRTSSAWRGRCHLLEAPAELQRHQQRNPRIDRVRNLPAACPCKAMARSKSPARASRRPASSNWPWFRAAAQAPASPSRSGSFALRPWNASNPAAQAEKAAPSRRVTSAARGPHARRGARERFPAASPRTARRRRRRQSPPTGRLRPPARRR